MQKGRYRTMVRQRTDHGCGAAALVTILRYAAPDARCAGRQRHLQDSLHVL